MEVFDLFLVLKLNNLIIRVITRIIEINSI